MSTRHRRKKLIVALLWCLIAELSIFTLVGDSSAAEKFPSREIIIITSVAAGSTTDLSTRVLAECLKKYVGVPVLVENRPEANGIKGVLDVYKAEPDGYTLLATILPRNVQMEIIFKTPYKSLDFTFLPAYFKTDEILAVNKNSPYNTLKALFEASKTRPLNCSIAGMGTLAHLFAQMLIKAGFHFEVVPYKGGGESVMALVGGHVDLTIADDSVVLRQKERLRLLAHADEERSEKYPDVSSFKELGYDLPNVYAIIGIGAPPRLPEEIRKILSDALTKAIKSPEFISGLGKLGVTHTYKSGPEFLAIAQSYTKVLEEYKYVFQVDEKK